MFTEQLTSEGRVLIGEGPDTAPLVAEALLEDRHTRLYDVGIVRGLLDEEGYMGLRALYRDSNRPARGEDLGEQMEVALAESCGTAIYDMNEVVTDFWQRENLQEELRLELHPRIRYATSIARPVTAHVDVLPNLLDRSYHEPRLQPITGPLSISVRFDNSSNTARTFYARRLHEKYQPTVDSSIFDPYTYEEYSKYKRLWNISRSVLFSKIEQRSGDAVMFPGHPWPSFHATKFRRSTLSALFDFNLTRPTD